MNGRSIGKKEKVGEEKFEGFDKKVLEMKSVLKMEGNMGRRSRISEFVVKGKKNG
jgi:small subunit ribosomal protein S5